MAKVKAGKTTMVAEQVRNDDGLFWSYSRRMAKNGHSSCLEAELAGFTEGVHMESDRKSQG